MFKRINILIAGFIFTVHGCIDSSPPGLKKSKLSRTGDITLTTSVVHQFNRPIALNLKKYLEKFPNASSFTVMTGQGSGARISPSELRKNSVVVVPSPGPEGKIRLLVQSGSTQTLEVIK